MAPIPAAADVLGDFHTAGRGVIDRRELLHRVDSKFLLREREVVPLLRAVQGCYDVVRVATLALVDVQTMYYDTPDLRCYHAHRRGLYTRHKVRVRHYLDRGLEYTEVKSRRADGATVKHRRLRPLGADWLDGADRRFVEGCCDLPAAELGPRLSTRFRRLTLVSPDANERVTVDVDVRFRSDTSAGLGSTAIVEVKQWPFDPHTPVMHALRAVGACPTMASKYCTGLALTTRAEYGMTP